MTEKRSFIAFWVGAALIIAGAFFYYPKWRQTQTEATLSWDVSGYYFYLPAFLIYKDPTGLGFKDSILQRYRPTPDLQQAFKHPVSGRYIMKYACGQAIQYLPWFLIAHMSAAALGYPADGFSLPYQAAVSWGSILVALIGLWFLRKSLLRYFSDGITAAVLICIVFGSNYLNYTAFDGAMTHNWLFTLYSLLIYATIRFYEQPSKGKALSIGVLCGLAALTRPTEIISVLIPLLWGMQGLRARLTFFKNHIPALTIAAAACIAVGAIQVAYWKYASGEWIVYSYQEQGFDWLKPHILDGLFSFRAGWLIYSPMMLFAVAGFLPLRRRLPEVFPAALVFCLLFMYITWAWQIWWYGGSLGQRAMVQSYPVWAFSMAALIEWAGQRTAGRAAFALLAGFFIWHNLWWTHQAHKGGLYISEQMTKSYWLRVWGQSWADRDALKLLDTKDEYRLPLPADAAVIYYNSFDADSTATTSEEAINGPRSLLLSKERQFSPEYSLAYPPQTILQGKFDHPRWLRAETTYRCTPKEWDWWRMTQFIVRFYQGNQVVRERMIRLQRHVDGSENKAVHFDMKLPYKDFDRIAVLFWNAESDKSVRIDDLKLILF